MEDSLYRIVSTVFGVDPSTLSPDTHFKLDLGADAKDIVKLIRQMNEEFQIEVPEEDIEDMQTMRDAINYMIQHRPY